MVYCDPPYRNTNGYDGKSGFGDDDFYAPFYDWCLNADFPVFISEYEMPEPFAVYAEFDKNCLLDGYKREKKLKRKERIYVPPKTAEWLKETSIYCPNCPEKV